MATPSRARTSPQPIEYPPANTSRLRSPAGPYNCSLVTAVPGAGPSCPGRLIGAQALKNSSNDSPLYTDSGALTKASWMGGGEPRTDQLAGTVADFRAEFRVLNDRPPVVRSRRSV